MNVSIKTIALFALGLAIAFALIGSVVAQNKQQAKERAARVYPVMKTPEQWKKVLTPEQYNVLREAGTERPGTSKLLNNHEKGTFVCAACALPLFSSETKFESGTGWPSFYKPINDKAVIDYTDNTLGMSRTENVCARCGGHLGHVFNDGPKPTGLRYCMNGVALKFIPAKTTVK